MASGAASARGASAGAELPRALTAAADALPAAALSAAPFGAFARTANGVVGEKVSIERRGRAARASNVF